MLRIHSYGCKDPPVKTLLLLLRNTIIWIMPIFPCSCYWRVYGFHCNMLTLEVPALFTRINIMLLYNFGVFCYKICALWHKYEATFQHQKESRDQNNASISFSLVTRSNCTHHKIHGLWLIISFWEESRGLKTRNL